MPVPTPEQYLAMLDAASEQGYAYAAVNVTSSQTLNAALRGFADAEADGIVQVTTGGAAYLAGDPGDEAGHEVAHERPRRRLAARRDHALPEGWASRFPRGRDARLHWFNLAHTSPPDPVAWDSSPGFSRTPASLSSLRSSSSKRMSIRSRSLISSSTIADS